MFTGSPFKIKINFFLDIFMSFVSIFVSPLKNRLGCYCKRFFKGSTPYLMDVDLI